jgi:hypothetical protein
VAQAAASLSAGVDEGLVLVFERPDGQASMRKWKNSAEGSSVAAKHAELLRGCLRGVPGGMLDARIVEMVETMIRVAEAETRPAKQGRSKDLEARLQLARRKGHRARKGLVHEAKE